MRLIDADMLKAKVPNTNVDIFENCRNCSTLMDWEVKELIDKMPTIDDVEKRIEGLQELVDINTERCEELRKQLREAHENYEKHLNELQAKLDEAEISIKNYKDLYLSRKREELLLAQQIPKDGEWKKGIHTVECSCCCEKFYLGDETWVEDFDICEDIGWKYCPNCGARMRKGEQE